MLDKNFCTAVSILNKEKIDYWICHGTLLGLVRDKKLIEWDNDVDIGVLNNEKTKNKINKIFKKKGFKKKKKFFKKDGLVTFEKKGGREVDINFYEPYYDKKNKKEFVIAQWYIPRNIFCKIIDAISNASKYDGKFKFAIKSMFIFEKLFLYLKKKLIKKKYFYKKIGYSHPINFIKMKKKLNIKHLKVLIPSNAQKYLQYIYGKNWRIPKKQYVWYIDSPSLNTKID